MGGLPPGVTPIQGDQGLPPGVSPLPEGVSEAPPAERSTLQKVIAPAVAAQNWLGKAAAVPFRLAGKLDVASGIKTPEQAESRAQSYGNFTRDFAETAMVPWSKAAGLAGTGIRALQSGGVGATQGLLEKGDVKDAAKQGLISAAASPAAEGLMALAGKVVRSLPGVANKITRQDAERLGVAIGEISDPLKGATTAAEIQRLAGGVGQRRLSKAKEAIVQEIERMSGNPKLMLPTFGENAQLTLRAANAEMTKLGNQAFGPKKDFAKIEQWRAMEQDLFASLDLIHPDLAAMYKGANQEWMKGTYLLNFLSMQPAYRETAGGTLLNTPYLQKRVSAPKPGRALSGKLDDSAQTLLDDLGSGDFSTLVKSLKRGATEGADEIRSTSPFSMRGIGSALGLGAVGGLAGGPVGTLATLAPFALPNLLSSYVGRAPYSLGGTGKAISAMTGKGASDLVREVNR